MIEKLEQSPDFFKERGEKFQELWNKSFPYLEGIISVSQLPEEVKIEMKEALSASSERISKEIKTSPYADPGPMARSAVIGILQVVDRFEGKDGIDKKELDDLFASLKKEIWEMFEISGL